MQPPLNGMEMVPTNPQNLGEKNLNDNFNISHKLMSSNMVS